MKAALFDGAAAVVGEYGYLNAMILMITARANVANGTFYNHFESRQDLFDQLLVVLGAELLAYIDERTRDAQGEIDRERQRLVAFFDFLKARPELYRILFEAEAFAPAAFADHTDRLRKRYASLLGRALESGEISGYRPEEMEVIALIFMGARQYLAMHYVHQGEGDGVPDWAFDTYAKFIAGGLRALAEP